MTHVPRGAEPKQFRLACNDTAKGKGRADFLAGSFAVFSFHSMLPNQILHPTISRRCRRSACRHLILPSPSAGHHCHAGHSVPRDPRLLDDAVHEIGVTAFLINAYNAFTVELILTRYPKLASIGDLGSLLQNPWKLKFIKLLDTQMSLDNIEHDTLRARGRYDDPRVHFAVNCASIGCPMLREEGFVAERLDAQLDEQTGRFMSAAAIASTAAATGSS